MKKRLLILLLIILFPLNIKAVELAKNSSSTILMEFSTGKILYESNSDAKMSPASTTKVMTLLLIMESLDSGKISLTDKVYISANASSMGGSQVFLEANSEMKVVELLKSISIASANDAAVAMAEHIAGSEEVFVQKMNDKCKSLGCINTNFANTHGLDAENHYTSAHDLALIANELLKHEKIVNYTSIYEEYLNKPDGTSTWMVNTNKVVCE